MKQLIFTSSASVVFDGTSLYNVDETRPYCAKHFDAYNESKALAEAAVLEANGKQGLSTVALRPASIFGPRDVQAWPGFIGAAKGGKSKVCVWHAHTAHRTQHTTADTHTAPTQSTEHAAHSTWHLAQQCITQHNVYIAARPRHNSNDTTHIFIQSTTSYAAICTHRSPSSLSQYQIGDGSNTVDWTYVENVAYAHVLASDRLLKDTYALCALMCAPCLVRLACCVLCISHGVVSLCVCVPCVRLLYLVHVALCVGVL